MSERIPQSTAITIPLYAVLSSDHNTPATGKTIAVTISKNTGGFGNPSAGATNATEIASGWYYVTLSTADTGTLGPLIILGTAATIDNVTIAYNVVAATNGGLTALPNTAVTTNASLLTSGTGTDQIAVASGDVTVGTNSDKTGYSLAANQAVNASQINGVAAAAANLAKSANAIGRGTVTTGGSTTSVPTSAFTPAGAIANQFNGRVVLFDADTTTTTLRGVASTISASSNAASPTFTVAALPATPASGDTFSVL